MKTYFLILGLILSSVIGVETPAQTNINPQVEIINVEDLSRILTENKGLPLLINVWATWCVPCREEFPELVKLAKTYQNKLRVIGISADDPDILNSKVIPFLKSQDAEFENYLIKVKDPEDIINLLSKDWSGAIPATFIYDKGGTQNEILIGKQSYEEFERAVKKVID